MKAILVHFNSTVPKTHNLELLMDKVAVHVEIPPVVRAAEDLTPYATVGRYPADYEPNSEDAYTDALAKAEKTLMGPRIFVNDEHMSKDEVLGGFSEAIEQLDSGLKSSPKSEMTKLGCIQFFEFCFELAWKSIKATAQEQGLADRLSPKTCLREALANGWIKNEETWLQMLEARNKMSHTYNTNEALKVYESLTGFYPELKKLHQALKQTK